MSAQALRYKPSFIGVARHAWINKPDTKYNTEGLYHVGLIGDLSDATVQAFKDEIDAAVDLAFAEEVEKAKLKPAQAKAWSKYYPYVEEKDEDTGVPTGRIIANFKQNAIMTLRDGSKKVFVMGIRDSMNKAVPKDTPVYGGATIRVLYKPRNVKVAGTKQFGVRLDFSMVQLLKAAERTGAGFDEVEGGYVGEESQQDPASEGTASPNSEY